MSTFLLNILCLISMASLVKAIDLTRVRMHTNFTITSYATSLSIARSLTQSKNDPRITYIGSGSGGTTVYALIDQGIGSAPLKYSAIKGLNSPGGVEWYQGSLFVSEMNQIHRFDNIDTRFINESLTKAKASLSSQVYSNWTAHGNHHGLKGVMAIKDGLIYMPIGSPCNHPKDGSDRADCVNFGQIITIDTSTLKITGEVAKGHRNSVGMDFSPKTGELWFTDNGRDEWGLPGNDSARFLRPADELNRMRINGQHFGFPNCYGSGLTWESGGNDPLFYTSSCIATDSPYTNAEWDVGAHTASLGMQFLSPKSTWPDKFQGSILIAQHGCWNCEGGNRGFQVIAVHLDSTGTRATGQTTIADFRTYNGASNGRPVDIQNMADGSILVSDDSEGAVYRISYNGPGTNGTGTGTGTGTGSNSNAAALGSISEIFPTFITAAIIIMCVLVA